jgi:hypothetical protein
LPSATATSAAAKSVTITKSVTDSVAEPIAGARTEPFARSDTQPLTGTCAIPNTVANAFADGMCV